MTETRQPTIEDIKSRRDRIKAELDNESDLTPRELNLARVYFADCQILTEMVERLEGEIGKFHECGSCEFYLYDYRLAESSTKHDGWKLYHKEFE